MAAYGAAGRTGSDAKADATICCQRSQSASTPQSWTDITAQLITGTRHKQKLQVSSSALLL